MSKKLFENGICERCKKRTERFTMSIFNTQMICINCKTKETNHPLYAKAKQKELEETRRKNYNFEGIGLPEDLKEVTD